MLKPDLSEHQHFWHGDLFIIRFGEMKDNGNDFDRNGNTLYKDVHPAILIRLLKKTGWWKYTSCER